VQRGNRNKRNIFYVQYNSPNEKSGSNRVKAVLVNPTNSYTLFEIFDYKDDQISAITNSTVVIEPREVSTSDGTEFERGLLNSKKYFINKNLRSRQSRRQNVG
jgi:hypothetical protein